MPLSPLARASLVLLVLGVGILLLPPLALYERLLWEDVWGPAVADAHQWAVACLDEDGKIERGYIDVGGTPRCPSGGVAAREGYTWTSEILYGAILIASLYAIYRGIFLRMKVEASDTFVLSLLPVIFLGPLGRVLEDSNAFCLPTSPPCTPSIWSFFWISPFEYIQLGLGTVAAIVVGVKIRDRSTLLGWRGKVSVMGALVGAEVLLLSLLVIVRRGDFTAPVLPLVPLALVAGGALSWGIYLYLLRRGFGGGVESALLSLFLPPTLAVLALDLSWASGSVWSAEAWNGRLFPVAGALIVLLAAGACLVTWGVGRALSSRYPLLSSLTAPLGLLIVFGHALDGIATWMATNDPFRLGLPTYGEKHPLSALLLDVGIQGALFPIVKIVLSALVVVLLEREWRKEKRAEDRTIVGLVRLAVLVLGFAPGLRDVARIVMGV